jgi:hypothetical protein
MSSEIYGGPELARGAERRYLDAYAIASVINGFGDTVKVLAIVFGAVLLLIAFASPGGFGGVFVRVIIVVAAVVFGALIYLFGVVLAAQGQMLKATLDTAVNGSPFLSDEARARMMALPWPRASADVSGSVPPVASLEWRCASCNAANGGMTSQCKLCGESRVA